jgi:hypothetical protein
VLYRLPSKLCFLLSTLLQPQPQPLPSPLQRLLSPPLSRLEVIVTLAASARATAPKARSFNAPIMAAAQSALASLTKMSRLMGQCARASRIAQIITTVRLGTIWCARSGTILTAHRSVFVSKAMAADRFNAVWHRVMVQSV